MLQVFPTQLEMYWYETQVIISRVLVLYTEHVKEPRDLFAKSYGIATGSLVSQYCLFCLLSLQQKPKDPIRNKWLHFHGISLTARSKEIHTRSPWCNGYGVCLSTGRSQVRSKQWECSLDFPQRHQVLVLGPGNGLKSVSISLWLSMPSS
ncbi:hypothetical protein DPMN_125330 [Dreissena polymorpha]|uniref:Uncharacterized protein n=1 Tax=Dreissena polymorpha TaxID=45954 RepID=A0A9D4GU80_DREPO|nr:hypothetical protein DPMN_125330 [Dreissena polymorpha]